MRKLIIALAVCAAIIPAPASGQVADAILTYQAQERDPWIGGLVEWVIPTAGHAYAGDVKRGLVPAAVSFGGLAAALWGLGLGDNPVGVDAPRVMFESEGSAVVTALGALAWVGGRVWGTVSAVQAVGDANAALLDRLGVSEDRIDLGTLVTPTGQMGLQFRISIP